MKTAKLNYIHIVPFILLAILCGIWGGWIRLGWQLPLTGAAGKHGAIMVGAFLGTLISLERASIIKKSWAWLAPLCSGSSIIFILLGLETIAYSLICLGSLGLAAMVGSLVQKHDDFYLKIMLGGALCWLVGNLMVLVHNSFPLAAGWWMGFLLLTITSERIEISRFLPVSKLKQRILVLAVALFVVGLVLPFHSWGRYISGIAMALVGLWLLKYDMATKSIKRRGLSRYNGSLLLAGYSWLIICGLTMLLGNWYGYMYDATLHAFFIGFVMTMIFAHAPIILPGVAGFSFRPFSPTLYFWAILLQASLLLRFTAGLLELSELRMWAGIFNGTAILCFFMHMALLSRQEIRKLHAHQKPAIKKVILTP